MRPNRTGLIDAEGGCFLCHGDVAGWDTRNSVGLAAQHHARTGHPTWANQIISMSWGERYTELRARQAAEHRAAEPALEPEGGSATTRGPAAPL